MSSMTEPAKTCHRCGATKVQTRIGGRDLFVHSSLKDLQRCTALVVLERREKKGVSHG